MKKRLDRNFTKQSAFTIVELLIVVIVIAILALLVFVAYRSFSDRAETTVIESDLTQAAKELAMDKALTGNYPSDENDINNRLAASTGVNYEYTADSSSFCLSAVKGDKAYHITNSGSSQEGVCSGHAGPSVGGGESTGSASVVMQAVTTANCPTERTRSVDARDNHTYWVQKLADGRCWMLTDLAYAGGGTNTHGDVKALQNGSSDSDLVWNLPKYYIQSASSPTTDPADPSVSTDGTGQYGYLYNWCAAMGAQIGTGACALSTSGIDTSISICPSGWRLPTGNGGEFEALRNAIDTTGITGSSVDLRETWLAQYAGLFSMSTSINTRIGQNGYYWSSTIGGNNMSVYRLVVNPNGTTATSTKPYGQAVRCLAA